MTQVLWNHHVLVQILQCPSLTEIRVFQFDNQCRRMVVRRAAKSNTVLSRLESQEPTMLFWPQPESTAFSRLYISG